MDLILWRHAHAEDDAPGGDDLARPLSGRGEEQAARMAAWLEPRLPAGTRILCSPALRCEQTAFALGRRYEQASGLAPGSTAQQVLELAQWPVANGTVLAVGHQPTLGQVVARLLRLNATECSVRKGGVWWLRTQSRGGPLPAIVLAVLSPDAL